MIERPRKALPALVVLLVALPIYVLRLNGAAGLVVDDAWYVMLAQSLAEGRGYTLINAPLDGILPGYPPGFPALLSIAFHLLPRFPQNVWLLKSVSIVAMLVVGVLTYAYVRRRQLPKELSACVAMAVTITPAFVFLATSTVMTECVFTLLQLATILLIHRGVETGDDQRGRRFTIAAALTAAATVLVRSAGIGVALAAGLWLLQERLWNRAIWFGAIAALCVLPWIVYARAHAPTSAEQALHGGSITYSYGQQFWMRWAGYPAAGMVTIRDVPARVATNIVDISARSMGGIFVPALFRGPAESGEEIAALGGATGLTQGSMGGAGVTMAISLVLGAIVLVGFVQTVRRRVTAAELLVPISLAITVMWPFWTFRFVVPLTPFLFFYLVAGIAAIASIKVARLALICLIGLNVWDHTRYVLEARDAARNAERPSPVTWLVQAHETDAVLEWIRHNLGAGVIATTNPGLVYLRTGHETVMFDRPHDDWAVWRTRGVRYVVSLLAVQPPASRGPFKLLYRSPGGFWVIEI